MRSQADPGAGRTSPGRPPQIAWRAVPVAIAAAGVLLVLAGLAPSTAWARRAGVAAPGCDGCHSGGRAPTVTLTASPLSPPVGTPMTLTVSVSATNGNVAGFFLTTYEVNNGSFRGLESGTLATKDGVTHTTPRTGTGTITFKAEWTASTATGVDFVVFALSGNGDGATRGDGGGQATLSTTSGCVGKTYYLDQDGDGFGTSDPAYQTRQGCTAPQSYAEKNGDCDDFNAVTNPGATERCDSKDNDCNGKVDDNIVYAAYCTDKDGDGHGITGGTMKMDCAPSAGFGDCKGDCNDNAKNVYPGATEICDGADNNCDGRVDEGVRAICGKGWCARYAEGCSTTCTPGPPMVETCNYFDDDCDGVVDNGVDAQLCGGPGLACVLGQCIPDDGGGSGGAGAGSSGSGGRAGSGGAGTSSGGSGGGGVAGSGSGGASTGGTGATASGCALAGGSGRAGAALMVAGGLLAFAALAARRRARQRDGHPLPPSRPPR